MVLCDQPGLLSVADARQRILENVKPFRRTEWLAIEEAIGRVCANDQLAVCDVPPADNSAMDGYAINTQDLPQTTFIITQRVTAGMPPSDLQPGTAARIFTGAEIPAGANAVIMQEQCSEEGSQVTISGSDINAGQNIRLQGNDLKVGDTVVHSGVCLTPMHIGLLASVGIAEVEVMEPLNVAVLSTGDELVMPGQSLASGQIYNSNYFVLSGLLEQLGANVLPMQAVKDSLAASCDALESAAIHADVIISTGGVSVGEEDHMRNALEKMGNLDLWKIAVKPGKPLAFGDVKGKPYFGLPGNPGSSLVTFMLFAAPYIRQLQGNMNNNSLMPISLMADFEWSKVSNRETYLHAKREKEKVVISPFQSSGQLSSACWADGLVIVPPESTINKGDDVAYLPFQAGMMV